MGFWETLKLAARYAEKMHLLLSALIAVAVETVNNISAVILKPPSLPIHPVYSYPS
jgi:hypothetical protein